MQITAIILVIISAFIHSIRDFFTKKANDKESFVWWYELFALIIYFPLFIFYIFKENPLNKIGLYIGLSVGVIHFLYWVFLSKSYHTGDLSHVYPIMRSSPLIILLFSIFILKEKVSLIGVSGILLVIIGVYTLHINKINIKELIKPIKLIWHSKATRFAFLTLITVSTYSLVDKIGVQYIIPIIYIYLLNISGFILFTPYVIKIKDKKIIKNEWVINKKSIIFNGFIVIFSYLLILYAFTIEKLSYIVGLRQISIIFAVMMGGHILKEKNKWIRLISSIIIFVGTFLISIAK